MYMENFTEETFVVIGIILLAIFVVFLIFVFRYSASSKNTFKKKMDDAGFELICYDLWKKGDSIFLVPNREMKSARAIEIIGLEEIRQNSKLVQLEIRYRLDGAINSMRIGGSIDELLTIEEELGYGG